MQRAKAAVLVGALGLGTALGVATVATGEVRAASTPEVSGPAADTPEVKGPMPEMGDEIPVLDAQGEVVGHVVRSEYLSVTGVGDQGREVEKRTSPIPVRNDAGSVIGILGSTGFLTLDEAVEVGRLTEQEAGVLARS